MSSSIGATGCSTNSIGRSAQRSSQRAASRRVQTPLASSRSLACAGKSDNSSSSTPSSSSMSKTPTFHLNARNPAASLAASTGRAAAPAGRSAATGSRAVPMAPPPPIRAIAMAKCTQVSVSGRKSNSAGPTFEPI